MAQGSQVQGAFLEAQELAVSTIEDEAVKRATLGGSDVLLISLLKAKCPQVYRENIRQEITGPADATLAPTTINIVAVPTRTAPPEPQANVTADVRNGPDAKVIDLTPALRLRRDLKTRLGGNIARHRP